MVQSKEILIKNAKDVISVCSYVAAIMLGTFASNQ